ncbi:MAG: hypothetical protein LW806_01085 [Planctomycetaceae bacterium]|nr:hypothetical protein [Planctomycetaceae bacterium]
MLALFGTSIWIPAVLSGVVGSASPAVWMQGPDFSMRSDGFWASTTQDSGAEYAEPGAAAAKRREISALESRIAERQAAWDAKYAEYQKMLANSGGRLNRAGQAKVARLDAEAREIKAEIDAAKEQLVVLEEELEDMLDAARKEAERSRTVPKETEQRERQGESRSGETSAQDERADTPGGSSPARGRLGGGQGVLPRPGSMEQRTPPSNSSQELAFRPLLDDLVWIFDPFDPVGGKGALAAEILRRSVESKFGKSVVDEAYSVEPVFYAEGGRRAIEGKSVDYMRGGARDDASHEVDLFAERPKDDQVLLERMHIDIKYADGHGAGRRTISSAHREGDGLVVRLENRGDSHVLIQYKKDGAECGRIEIDFERAGDARRLVEMRASGDGIHQYRIGQHPFGGSPYADGKTAIYRWSYDATGRVARLRMKTIDRSPEMQYLRDMVEASGSDRRERIERSIQLAEQSYAEWTYTYDDRGRLLEVTKRAVSRALGKVEQLQLMSKGTPDDELALRVIEQKIANDPEFEYRTAPGDGVVIEPFDEGVQSVLTERRRCTEWDERGRWKKMSVFAVDEAGETENRRIERVVLEQDGRADRAGREWQLFGLSPAEGEDKHRRLASAFASNGAAADPSESSVSPAPFGEERSDGTDSGGINLILLIVAVLLLVATIALVVILMTRPRAG